MLLKINLIKTLLTQGKPLNSEQYEFVINNPQFFDLTFKKRP